jgi:hypothetical protein
MDNKGQAVLAEHVMVFFVVIAALVAMSTFVQRTFEARIDDARDYMINAVSNSSVCDANCVAASGGDIHHEYEPYYLQQLSDVQSNGTDKSGIMPGSATSIGAIYLKSIHEGTTTISTSCQLPPQCADSALANTPACRCSTRGGYAPPPPGKPRGG